MNIIFIINDSHNKNNNNLNNINISDIYYYEKYY